MMTSWMPPTARAVWRDPYSQVTDLVETERYFLVFLKKRTVCSGPQNGFYRGRGGGFQGFPHPRVWTGYALF